MLEAYSLNITVPALSAVPWNNLVLQKGCTAMLSAPATIQLNKCGVYMIECDCSSAAASTIQLFKDGVALPQAQSTGTSPSFTTLVQVPTSNSSCCCSSPVLIQLRNPTDTAETFTDANIVITKIC